MLIKHCEVLIVGAGPAGLALGYMLQNKGISCCIVDSSKVLGDKPCAGGTTPKMRKLMREIYHDNFLKSIRYVKTDRVVITSGKYKHNVMLTNPVISVDRKELASWMLDKYREVGGKIYTHESLVGINEKKSIAATSRRKIAYSTLVGADGINSRVRHLCYKDSYKVPNYVEYKNVYNDSGTINNDILINWDDRVEYIWPRPGIIQYACHSEKPTRKAFPVNVNASILKQNKDNIVLIGAAALLENPCTAEGLYTALLSAKMFYYSYLGAGDYYKWISKNRFAYNLYKLAWKMANNRIALNAVLRHGWLVRLLMNFEVNKGFIR